MTLWIILTIMTALAAVAAAAPFLRRLDAPKTPQSEDVEVYRDQLKEIEREEKSGLIEAHGAGEARKEIARRLIAAGGIGGAWRPAARRSLVCRDWRGQRRRHRFDYSLRQHGLARLAGSTLRQPHGPRADTTRRRTGFKRD